MADILTQIQNELDMLLNQMQSSLAYIHYRTPPAAILKQLLLSSFAEREAQAQQAAAQQAASNSSTQQPPAPAMPPPLPTSDEFQKDIRELSRDLLLKEQQIEILVGSLPGLHSSEAEQLERMCELKRELEELDGERIKADKEKEELARLVEGRIMSLSGKSFVMWEAPAIMGSTVLRLFFAMPNGCVFA